MPSKPAVALDPTPPAAELLAAKAAGMTWLAWREAGKPMRKPAGLVHTPVNRIGNGEQNPPEIASRGVRPWHPYRSKWEWRYAERLAYELAIGLLRDYSYETER